MVDKPSKSTSKENPSTERQVLSTKQNGVKGKAGSGWGGRSKIRNLSFEEEERMKNQGQGSKWDESGGAAGVAGGSQRTGVSQRRC